MEHKHNRHETEQFAFMQADAEASFTTSEQASHLTKGDYIMIRNRPCKIIAVSKKAPGKHGSAKCHFVSKEIFTNDKMEMILSAHHSVDVPMIKKTEYLCMYPEMCVAGNHVTLMDLTTCETRAELKLPEDEDMAMRIKAIAAANVDADVNLVVLAACGTEKIIDFKVVKAA